MTWPEDAGWHVRMGVGLLEHTPMSPERRAAVDREAEKEHKAAELEAEQRRSAAAEHAGDLLFRGTEAHSAADVMTLATYGVTAEQFAANSEQILHDEKRREEAQDKAAARRDAEAGIRPSRQSTLALLAEAKAAREAREAAAEGTPASKAEVGRLTKAVQNAFHNLTGHKPEL